MGNLWGGSNPGDTLERAGRLTDCRHLPCGGFCTTPQKGIVHLETGETQLFPYPHSAISEN
jgi:hypothetical protein